MKFIHGIELGLWFLFTFLFCPSPPSHLKNAPLDITATIILNRINIIVSSHDPIIPLVHQDYNDNDCNGKAENQ